MISCGGCSELSEREDMSDVALFCNPDDGSIDGSIDGFIDGSIDGSDDGSIDGSNDCSDDGSNDCSDDGSNDCSDDESVEDISGMDNDEDGDSEKLVVSNVLEFIPSSEDDCG